MILLNCITLICGQNTSQSLGGFSAKNPRPLAQDKDDEIGQYVGQQITQVQHSISWVDDSAMAATQGWKPRGDWGIIPQSFGWGGFSHLYPPIFYSTMFHFRLLCMHADVCNSVIARPMPCNSCMQETQSHVRIGHAQQIRPICPTWCLV